MHRYKVLNSAVATAAAPVKVSTGTVIKTMLQLALPSTRQCQVLAWGYSLDAAPAGAGVGVVELMEANVAATVTAHVASGVQPLDPNAPPSLLTLGAAATGYSASAEGAVTAARTFDAPQVTGISNGSVNAQYAYQFTPAERPVVAVSKFLRVRATFSAAVNMLAWVVIDE